MEQLQFNKFLSEETIKTIGELEEHFHQVFRHIVYFQDNLNNQSGKAATALKRNLNRHLDLMGKSSVTLLNFADVMYHLMRAIRETDEGNANLSIPTGRQAMTDSLSPERIEEEISFDSNNLNSYAINFQNNITNINELFSSFDHMLMNVISNSTIPWDDYDSVWNEAKNQIELITEVTQEHINKLLDETEQFI